MNCSVTSLSAIDQPLLRKIMAIMRNKPRKFEFTGLKVAAPVCDADAAADAVEAWMLLEVDGVVELEAMLVVPVVSSDEECVVVVTALVVEAPPIGVTALKDPVVECLRLTHAATAHSSQVAGVMTQSSTR